MKVAIEECILQVESASSIPQIKSIKKLTGFDNHYRIRVGDYRIGIKIEKGIVYFVVFAHRKEVYKRFP